MQLENFIALPARSFVFAYVPKVACTNWKSVFRYLNGAPDYLDAQLAHDRKNSGLLYLDRLPKADAMAMLSDASVQRYTFVRNPYSRVLSAYMNKLKAYAEDGVPERPGDYFYAVYLAIDSWRAAQRPAVPHVDFALFLDWLKHSGEAMVKNEHWRPQHEIISPESVQFDFIGRFENLATDAASLLARMGCDIPFPSREAIRFPSSGAQQRLGHYLDKNTMPMIEELYAQDFASLGYALGELPA